MFLQLGSKHVLISECCPLGVLQHKPPYSCWWPALVCGMLCYNKMWSYYMLHPVVVALPSVGYNNRASLLPHDHKCSQL